MSEQREMTNEDRARRAEEAVVAYDGEDRQWSAEEVDLAYQVIKDLLGDLHHLCDRVGVNFDGAVVASYTNYSTEASEDATGLTAADYGFNVDWTKSEPPR